MGVKDLWGIISPTGELLSLSSLQGKVVAVDLSCWICDSQNVNMGRNVIRPHLRNLFFRCVSLIRTGILPVFVLEGNAPIMKFNTIQNRIDKRPNQSNHKGNTGKNLGKRSRLQGLIAQCRQLLTLMGLPWVQAEGEAEATCAALAYYQLVDGVITQDSDVFLYGASLVYRNFSADQNKATVEQFKVSLLESRLMLNRNDLVCLALLLGCDYIPAGVPGVGKDMALKLLSYWKAQKIKNPIERIRNWTNESSSECSPEHMFAKGKIRDEDIEQKVKQKALRTCGFPFNEVIEEFTKKLAKPKITIKWSTPQVLNLIKWCIEMLGWEAEYSFEKVVPIATRWILCNALPDTSASLSCLKPRKICRKCVRHGVCAYEVAWDVEPSFVASLHQGITTEVKTIESSFCFEKSFPQIVNKYLEENHKPKAKSRKKDQEASKMVISRKKKLEGESNKENRLPEMEEEIFNNMNDSVDELELSRVIKGFIDLTVNSPVKCPPNRVKMTKDYSLTEQKSYKEVSKNLKKVSLKYVSPDENEKRIHIPDLSPDEYEKRIHIPDSSPDENEKKIHIPDSSPDEKEKRIHIKSDLFNLKNNVDNYGRKNLFLKQSTMNCFKEDNIEQCQFVKLNTNEGCFKETAEHNLNICPSEKLQSSCCSEDLFNDSNYISDDDCQKCAREVSLDESLYEGHDCSDNPKEIDLEILCSSSKCNSNESITIHSYSTPVKNKITVEKNPNFLSCTLLNDVPLGSTQLKSNIFCTKFKEDLNITFESPIIESLPLAERLRKKYEGQLGSIIDSLK